MSRIEGHAVCVVADDATRVVVRNLTIPVMAWLTAGAPVRSIPEETDVATVRNMVVDDVRGRDDTALVAVGAQRIALQEPHALAAPEPVVVQVGVLAHAECLLQRSVMVNRLHPGCVQRRIGPRGTINNRLS